MKFTKLFAVAAVATSLTGGAFAMEEHGNDYADKVRGDAAFAEAHRDHLKSLESTADAIATILKTLGLPGSDFVKACQGTDLKSMKTCMTTLLVKAPQLKKDRKLQTALIAGCNSATCKNTSVREACGVVACNALGKDAGKKGTCWAQPCSNFTGTVYNCLDRKGCGSYMD